MANPKVSICVPNLNTLPFLPERFETIFNQTFQDWELLVYDGYSDDGAWEYISQLAAKEPRMRSWQGAREGTPGSWSPCVREARGDYVYVATSDDTMAPDCLEKLVGALEAHPECDIAHCRLRTIDERGEDTDSEWWPADSIFARSSGDLLQRPHIRRAPYDGLLHLLNSPVYISVTQLLIRRSLFDRIGFFKSQWGSVGDYNWNMRAGLVANTIHVPDTWGGWRVHASQATAGVALRSLEHSRKIEGMIEDAIASCGKTLAPNFHRPLRRAEKFGAFMREVGRRSNVVDRRAFIARRLLAGSGAARTFVRAKLGLGGMNPWPQSAVDLIRAWLEYAGSEKVLLPL